MRRPSIRDLYPRTFELIERTTEEAYELVLYYLNRGDEERTFPEEDKKRIGDKISDLTELWSSFDTDFPKENLNSVQVIEDYIWMEHIVMELEEATELFQANGQKPILFSIGNWIKEIIAILDE